jgi:hypothetical protein
MGLVQPHALTALAQIRGGGWPPGVFTWLLLRGYGLVCHRLVLWQIVIADRDPHRALRR